MHRGGAEDAEHEEIIFLTLRPRRLCGKKIFLSMSRRDNSELKTGINGLPHIALTHPSGARLDVYLHGAHAVSWRDAEGREMLFLSEKSRFQPDAPIRGGIPIVFPQFGAGPLPKHGFVRIQAWTFLGAGLADTGWAEAGFELTDNAETIKLWPHKFRLKIVFRLKAAELEVSFSVQNPGQSEFEFKNGLHTYFAAADIGRVAVKGLAGAGFIDFLGDKTVRNETREKIIFDQETDRVYPAAPDKLALEDGGRRQRIIIEKRGMNDVVIWNPWIEKSKRMEDFGDIEYNRMVCVETGNLHEPLHLNPGAIHDAFTRFRRM